MRKDESTHLHKKHEKRAQLVFFGLDTSLVLSLSRPLNRVRKCLHNFGLEIKSRRIDATVSTGFQFFWIASFLWPLLFLNVAIYARKTFEDIYLHKT